MESVQKTKKASGSTDRLITTSPSSHIRLENKTGGRPASLLAFAPGVTPPLLCGFPCLLPPWRSRRSRDAHGSVMLVSAQVRGSPGRAELVRSRPLTDARCAEGMKAAGRANGQAGHRGGDRLGDVMAGEIRCRREGRAAPGCPVPPQRVRSAHREAGCGLRGASLVAGSGRGMCQPSPFPTEEPGKVRRQPPPWNPKPAMALPPPSWATAGAQRWEPTHETPTFVLAPHPHGQQTTPELRGAPSANPRDGTYTRDGSTVLFFKRLIFLLQAEISLPPLLKNH